MGGVGQDGGGDIGVGGGWGVGIGSAKNSGTRQRTTAGGGGW